ncbi:MAG: hypothetical protein QOC92_465 [Acidimicrobiaceae bacterium]
MGWRRLTMRGVSSLARAVPHRSGRRILLFHAVGTEVVGYPFSMSVPVDAFADDLDAMVATGVDLASMTSPIGDRPSVAVTFDDGYADVIDAAAPIMATRAAPFTVFVTLDFLDTGAFLSRSALADVAALPGATVGFHGRSHTPLTRLDDHALRLELDGGRRELEDLVGQPVTSMSYPSGCLDSRVRRAVAEAGFTHGATSRYGVNRPGDDPLTLRRCEIVDADRPIDVARKATGGWDWLGVRRHAR